MLKAVSSTKKRNASVVLINYVRSVVCTSDATTRQKEMAMVIDFRKRDDVADVLGTSGTGTPIRK